MNAWDAGRRVVADLIHYARAPLFPNADGSNAQPSPGRLTRWTLDLDGGTDGFAVQTLDDLPGEFPRIDDRRSGLPTRFGAIAAEPGTAAGTNAIAWYDLETGGRTVYRLPDGDATSESVFVPRSADAPEGDGWLLATIWRRAENRSDLVVLDTQGIDRGPVATVQLSHRVPFGFHGNFVAEDML